MCNEKWNRIRGKIRQLHIQNANGQIKKYVVRCSVPGSDKKDLGTGLSNWKQKKEGLNVFETGQVGLMRK